MPGMFPNMFPLAPGQVFSIYHRCLYTSLCDYFMSFNSRDTYEFILLQFGALPVMPVQAMTQQVCILDGSCYFLSPLHRGLGVFSSVFVD